MSATTYVGALELASGAVLVCAVMTLWRRSVRAIVTMLRLQGISLAAVAGVLAAHQHDAWLGATAVLVLVVKGVVVPELLRRIVRDDPGRRETSPLVNVPASLVFAAVLSFSLLIERTGLIVAAAALIGISCLRRLRTNPVEVLIIYVVLTGFSSLVFGVWLGIQLPLVWWQ